MSFGPNQQQPTSTSASTTVPPSCTLTSAACVMNVPASVGAEGPVRETDVDVGCCWLGPNDMATVAAGATIATSERLREAGRRMHATKVAPPSPSLALVVPSANAKVKSTAGDITVTFTGRGVGGLEALALAEASTTAPSLTARAPASTTVYAFMLMPWEAAVLAPVARMPTSPRVGPTLNTTLAVGVATPSATRSFGCCCCCWFGLLLKLEEELDDDEEKEVVV